jgi:creatinine amidohydrolase
MAAFRKIWWNDFTAAEFDGIDPMRTIAVLPTAAMEQHGPHLPVGVDTFLNRGPLDMLVPRIPANLDVRILPVQTVGKSNEHIWQKGTISSTAHTLIDLWTEIGQSISRTGVKKLVIVNSHGGNVSIIDIVARELRVSEQMLVVKTSWSAFATPDGLVSDLEKRHGIHAGDVETSEMLHFQPDLVDMAKARDFASVAARDEQQFKYLRPTGMHAYGWIASDLNPSGAVGNAANATPERGRLIAEAQVAGFIELLGEVATMPLPGTRG